MLPDSLLHLVDTVVVRETVSVLPETVKIAGRVLSESPRWWLPAVVTVVGTLIGALVGALVGARIGARASYDFNRKLEKDRAEEARRRFRWQREQHAASRLVDLLLEFMASLGKLQYRLGRAEEKIQHSRSTGMSSYATEAVGEVLFDGDAVQPTWDRLKSALVGFPGYWDPLRTAFTDLGDHFISLRDRLGAVKSAGNALKDPDPGQESSSFVGRLVNLSGALRECGTEIGRFMGVCKQLCLEVQLEIMTRDEPTIVVDSKQKNAVGDSQISPEPRERKQAATTGDKDGE